MFLSHQLYALSTYKYANKDIARFLESIENLLKQLISTEREFVLCLEACDLNKEQIDTYTTIPKEKETIISICLERFRKELESIIHTYIDKEISTYIEKEPIFLFQNNKDIYHQSNKNFIEKINKNISREINTTEISLTYFTDKISYQAFAILKIFLDNKIPLNKFITEDQYSFIDLTPIPILSIPEEISYTIEEDEVLISKESIDRLNTIFSCSLDPSTSYTQKVVFEDSKYAIKIGDIIFIHNMYFFIRSDLLKNKYYKIAYLQHSLLKEDSKARDTSEAIDMFKDAINETNEDLIVILSQLQNNLYTTQEIPQEILDKFFKIGYKVESTYLEQNQIFIPYQETTSALFGIHNNTEARSHAGTNQKGLKSWINSDSIEQNMSTKKAHTKAEKVTHLLPDLAFYFKEKFFEDFLENLLNQLRQDHPELNLKIFTNKICYIDEHDEYSNPLDQKATLNKMQEFDFIVTYVKEGQELVLVLEAKTKLSKFIIQDQAKKVEEYMRYDNLNIFDQYALIGFNNDEGVQMAMSYFIKQLPFEGADITDEQRDLAFKYPLPTTNQELYCIASTDTAVLKNNLLSLFK